MNVLKYTKPAKKWREALPLGNGITDIMIYGSLKKERLCFNDGTLWSGYPKDYNNPESLENLQKVRNLIFNGHNNEADALCESNLIGSYGEAFMPLGDVLISFNGISKTGYKRSLDLSKAIHTVKSDSCISEAFSSYPDKISAYRIKSDKPFSATVKAKSKLNFETETDGNSLYLLGNAPDHAALNYLRMKRHPIRYDEHKGMAFCLQTNVFTDGNAKYGKNYIKIKNATEVTLYFVTATGFNGFDKMPEAGRTAVKEKCRIAMKSVNKDFDTLKARHIENYSALYGNQSISFKGCFAGHDHMNNFSVNYKGIRLTYGLYCDHNIYVVPFRGGTLINIKNDGSFTTQSLIRHRGQSTVTVCKEK